MSVAGELARWAAALEPTADDLALADRALVDTIATAAGARRHAVRRLLGELPEPAAWSTLAHVLDFDDLHLESTAHVSVVCVPAALAAGGDARAYLAGAGVMARLGRALGWSHYAAGWHSTCTAGAPAAAAATAVALGLDGERIAAAMALAVPAAGGVQRAFGTEAKSLQVGFATGAGARAARLAAEGASADPGALDQWLALVGGDAGRDLSGPAVPGGLAIKLFPCCYALQRPISAMRELAGVAPERVARITVRAPEASLQPLIRRRPQTGLEGKFSLEYALAATILDERPCLESFTDDAIARPLTQALADYVEVDAFPGGDDLLAATVTIEVALDGGAPPLRAELDVPPGAPGRPPSLEDMRAKVADCAGELADEVLSLTWADAPAFLRERLREEQRLA